MTSEVLVAALLAFIGAYIVFRLQAGADRRLARELGQFDRPKLQISVAGEAWGKNGVGRLYWLHVLEAGVDPKPQMQGIRFIVQNVGESAAKDVLLRVRAPLMIFPEGASFKESGRVLGPVADIKTYVRGNFSFTEFYMASLPPKLSVAIQDEFRLRPTSVSDVVEVEGRTPLAYTALYALRLTIDVISEAGPGPSAEVEIVIREGKLVDIVLEEVSRVDAKEREAFHLDRRSLLWPIRFLRYTTKRPSVTEIDYLITRHDIPHKVRRKIEKKIESRYGDDATIEDPFVLLCRGAQWTLWDGKTLRRVKKGMEEPPRRWTMEPSKKKPVPNHDDVP